MDATVAAPPRTPQINCATLQPRAPYHRSAGQVLPTQCTNHRNHPRKIDTPLAHHRETGNSPTRHPLAGCPPPAAKKPPHPAAAQRPPVHKERWHEFQEPPIPVMWPRLAQTFPNLQTESAPHSKSYWQSCARPLTGHPTAQCPSPVPPSTPDKTASRPYRTAYSAIPDQVPSLWTWTFSRRCRCAPASASTLREKEL